MTQGCAGPHIGLAAAYPLQKPHSGEITARATCPPTGRQNILLLSSGGADGAFGAGFLTGWSATGKRPTFDIVTGASTGALQATAAFIGASQDPTLARMFTTTSTRDVMLSNGPLAALFGSGLYRLTPLRRRLEAVIDDAMLEEVAAAHRAGRRLYVATTDLTNGRSITWDMGAIAASSDAGRKERYIAVLLASSAVPGIIEPVVVTEPGQPPALHGDGATKSPIVFDEAMLAQCSTPADVWVVVNGHLSQHATTSMTTPRTLALVRRGVTQLMRRFLFTTAVSTYDAVTSLGARFNLASIPEDRPEAADPFDFDPSEMKRLFEDGRRQSQAPSPWRSSLSPPKRLSGQ